MLISVTVSVLVPLRGLFTRAASVDLSQKRPERKIARVTSQRMKNPKTVPPKIKNAKPHSDRFIANSLSIDGVCALDRVLDTNICPRSSVGLHAMRFYVSAEVAEKCVNITSFALPFDS